MRLNVMRRAECYLFKTAEILLAFSLAWLYRNSGGVVLFIYMLTRPFLCGATLYITKTLHIVRLL